MFDEHRQGHWSRLGKMIASAPRKVIDGLGESGQSISAEAVPNSRSVVTTHDHPCFAKDAQVFRHGRCRKSRGRDELLGHLRPAIGELFDDGNSCRMSERPGNFGQLLVIDGYPSSRTCRRQSSGSETAWKLARFSHDTPVEQFSGRTLATSIDQRTESMVLAM